MTPASFKRSPSPLVALAALSVAALSSAALGCGSDELPPPPPPLEGIEPLATPPGQGGLAAAGADTVITAGAPMQQFSGNAGGPIEAMNLSATCRGWLQQAPNRTITAASPTPVWIAARTDGDSTLVVQTPDGAFFCNDDSEGLNPALALTLPAGQTKVWVGSYASGTMLPYQLGVSGSPLTPSMLSGGAGNTGNIAAPSGGATAVLTGSVPAGLNVGTDSTFPTLALSPTLAISEGQSGGSINANLIHSSCRGFIYADRPDHMMSVPAAGYMKLVVTSTADTTLVVRRPDGTWLCNDDTFGTDPSVEGQVSPGLYQIWIGTYSQDNTLPRYRIALANNPGLTNTF